jgi:hypothetical protein
VGLALTLAAAGCGSGATVDASRVSDAMTQAIADQRGVEIPVRCPEDVEAEQGTRFSCRAILDVGTYEIAATVRDDDGNVDFASEQPLTLLDVGAVERAIRRSVRRQRDQEADVACPRRVLQRERLTFTCRATVTRPGGTVAPGTYGFRVTIVDDAGRVTYRGI